MQPLNFKKKINKILFLLVVVVKAETSHYLFVKRETGQCVYCIRCSSLLQHIGQECGGKSLVSYDYNELLPDRETCNVHI
jgi:hypothetical protein